MRGSAGRALLAAGLMAAWAMLGAASAPKIGEVAPDFTLKLIDGTSVRLGDLKGDVVVLNFWATWCVPCRKELPTLDAYYDLQKKVGLRVFAITTQDSVPLYQLKKLFAVMHIPAAKGIKGPYTIMGGVPTNYVIGRDGVLRVAKAGAFDLDELNAVLVPLLKEPAPAA